MICSKCGFENSDTAKFCNECGAALTVSSAEDTASVEDSSVLTEEEQSLRDGATLDLPPVYVPEEDEEDASFDDEYSPDTNVDQEDEYDDEVEEVDDEQTDEYDDLEEDFDTDHGSDYDADPEREPEPVVVDGFDFSPIDNGPSSDTPSYDPLADTHDASGFDEYLVDPNYVAAPKSWKTGDTMEMPRVEDEPSPKQVEYRAPEQGEKKGRGRIAAMAGVIALLVVALAVGGITYQMELWGGKSLPDVVSLDKDEATKILEDRGFVVKAMQVKSDDTEDKVLLMDPGAGRRLSEGSEVVLQVATPRIIPEIVGKPLSEAKESLDLEGFERIEYVKVKSNEAEDTVLAIDPIPGTKVQALTLIKVTIAEPYVVPDVIGKDISSAIDILNEEGYEVFEQYVYSDQPEYTVIGSDPAAGAKLASGSTVTIQIAKSRANELTKATNAFLEPGMTLTIEGTTYELVSVDGVTYTGGNTTSATITVVGVTTLPDGEEVRGSPKQRTISMVWNDDNTISSYS